MRMYPIKNKLIRIPLLLVVTTLVIAGAVTVLETSSARLFAEEKKDGTLLIFLPIPGENPNEEQAAEEEYKILQNVYPNSIAPKDFFIRAEHLNKFANLGYLVPDLLIEWIKNNNKPPSSIVVIIDAHGICGELNAGSAPHYIAVPGQLSEEQKIPDRRGYQTRNAVFVPTSLITRGIGETMTKNYLERKEKEINAAIETIKNKIKNFPSPITDFEAKVELYTLEEKLEELKELQVFVSGMLATGLMEKIKVTVLLSTCWAERIFEDPLLVRPGKGSKISNIIAACGREELVESTITGRILVEARKHLCAQKNDEYVTAGEYAEWIEKLLRSRLISPLVLSLDVTYPIVAGDKNAPLFYCPKK